MVRVFPNQKNSPPFVCFCTNLSNSHFPHLPRTESNNLDDVRDEWERIKLSYEILRDPRTRKRYDRHEVLADPGAAVGRAVADAALGAVGKGLAGVGSGIFAMGAFALDKLSGENKTKNEQQE